MTQLRCHPCRPSASPMGRRQGGWTIWESLVGVNVVGLAAILFTSLFSSLEGARHDAIARQAARADLRVALEAVVRVVRRADMATLDGFDAGGSSSSLTFASAVGIDGIGAVRGATERLAWRPVSASVAGIDAPGQVVHARAGVEHVLAERVPRGGFSVRWEAGLLVVELAVYEVYEGHAQTVLGSTSILIRN